MSWWIFVALFWSFCCAQEETCSLPDGIVAPEEVTIAGLYTSFLPQISSAIRLAINLVNEDPCLLPETHLNLVMGVDDGTASEGLREFMRIQKEYNPVAWTGLPYSTISRTIALASPLSETPLVSGTASLPDLSDSDVYPFFSRAIASDAYQGIVLADLTNEYGWDRVATISVNDAWATSIVEEYTNRANTYSIKFLSSATFPLSTSGDEDYLDQLRLAIKKTKLSGARVILLCIFPEETADFFEIALEEGLMGPPYTYLATDTFNPSTTEDEELLDKIRYNMRGIINVGTQSTQSGAYAEAWYDAWMSADPDEYYGAGVERFADHALLPLFRDAVYIVAHAIDRLIRRGEDTADGILLLETIQQETDFMGLTGTVHLQTNGDRVPKYDIFNRQDFSFDKVVIGWANEDELVLSEDAVFADGSTHIPDAAEEIYVDWDDVEAISMVALFSFGLIVALGCLIAMMTHRSTPILNYSSPRFVFGTGIGALVGLTNVFVWTGEPSSANCIARPWLLVLNFGLIFGHLYAKAFRFLWIMKQRKKLQFRPIPDIQLFICVFFYFLLFAIPCIVWTVSFPLDALRSDSNPDNDKVNIICGGDNLEAFLGVLLALGGLSLVIGVVVAFLNRNYHDFFSESTYIGYTMFTVCITCCIVLPMLFILKDSPHAFYVVLMLGIFLGNGAVVVFMFFPKVFVVLFAPEKNVIPLDSCGALKTKKLSSLSKKSGSDRSSKKSTGSDQSNNILKDGAEAMV